MFISGDHVPVIPFVEVVGKLILLPEQIGPNCTKVGISSGVISKDVELTLEKPETLATKENEPASV